MAESAAKSRSLTGHQLFRCDNTIIRRWIISLDHPKLQSDAITTDLVEGNTKIS